MRLSVLVGEDFSGNWMPIALPDKSVQEQRLTLKKIKIAQGVVEIGKKTIKLKRIMYFENYSKRAFFDAVIKKREKPQVQPPAPQPEASQPPAPQPPKKV